MKWYVSLLLCLLTSCGGINPEFEPYYKSFAKDFNIFPYTIGADFGKLEDGIGAVCNHGLLKITVKQDYWKDLDEQTRLELIYHELLHCTVWAKHTDKKLADGCPSSIMNSINFGAPCFVDHKQEYINQYKRISTL